VTESDVTIEIAKAVAALGPNEREVLLILARRLFVGQERYGLLDPHDGRDWRRERAEELQDLLVYTAIAELAATRKSGG
jgi:hypothetical protein